MPSQGQSVVDVVCPNHCHVCLLTSKPAMTYLVKCIFLFREVLYGKSMRHLETCQNSRTNSDYILTSESSMKPFCRPSAKDVPRGLAERLGTLSLDSRFAQKWPQKWAIFFHQGLLPNGSPNFTTPQIPSSRNRLKMARNGWCLNSSKLANKHFEEGGDAGPIRCYKPCDSSRHFMTLYDTLRHSLTCDPSVIKPSWSVITLVFFQITALSCSKCHYMTLRDQKSLRGELPLGPHDSWDIFAHVLAWKAQELDDFDNVT